MKSTRKPNRLETSITQEKTKLYELDIFMQYKYHQGKLTKTYYAVDVTCKETRDSRRFDFGTNKQEFDEMMERLRRDEAMDIFKQ